MDDLDKTLKAIERSTLGTDSEEDFAKLFEDLDLNSSKLGNSANDRNELVVKVLNHLDGIDFDLTNTEKDVLGDAYEYLIAQFASGAGKKAGEFYTPQPVSTLLARLVTLGKDRLKSVYDPTCGSGSLLLRVKRQVKNVDRIFGQEMNRTTYNLARMNMILHDVHMYYQLEEHGTMAVVLPHGVLFRGSSEGVIRQYLIENLNAIDTIIGLPANVFYGTSIPTCVLVLKKNRKRDDILFIDASNDFEKQKTQNVLLPEHIDKIMQAVEKRESIAKYAEVVPFSQIEENDFNLNIPRYVDTFEAEEEIDLVKISEKLAALSLEAKQTDKVIAGYCAELGIVSPFEGSK